MIWASCMFNGVHLGYIPVLDPGRWYGKAWFIEFVGDVPFRFVVEADSVSDAIEVLSDDPEFGETIHVMEHNLAACPEHEREYDSKGRVIDTREVIVHGQEFCDLPYPVRYHDEGYPAQGIDPRQYAVARFN